MSRKQPYIVRSDTSGGAATIVDRQTHESVGRVVQDFDGRWEAIVWRAGGSGTLLLDGRRAVTVDCCRYRGEAAGAVWAAFLRGEGTE